METTTLFMCICLGFIALLVGILIGAAIIAYYWHREEKRKKPMAFKNLKIEDIRYELLAN